MTITVARVESFVFRAPIATPVQTSFGIMRDRPAVFVRVTDADGIEGWGEIWCNFPAVGAEHRARLVTSVFVPMLEGKRFDSPEAAFKAITEQTEVLALQAAEPGPIAQCIAGIDMALWDLSARLANLHQVPPRFRVLPTSASTTSARSSWQIAGRTPQPAWCCRIRHHLTMRQRPRARAGGGDHRTVPP